MAITLTYSDVHSMIDTSDQLHLGRRVFDQTLAQLAARPQMKSITVIDSH